MKEIICKQCGKKDKIKRGVMTKGMCMDCYASYLDRLQRYSDRNVRMEHARANTAFASNSHDEETRLMAFFDCVMPEIPIWKAKELAKDIAESKKR